MGNPFISDAHNGTCSECDADGTLIVAISATHESAAQSFASQVARTLSRRHRSIGAPPFERHATAAPTTAPTTICRAISAITATAARAMCRCVRREWAGGVASRIARLSMCRWTRIRAARARYPLRPIGMPCARRNLSQSSAAMCAAAASATRDSVDQRRAGNRTEKVAIN